MTNRYVAHLITDVRDSTENTDFSDTIGIKDAEFLRYLNDAQHRIHNLLIQQHPSVFLVEKEYSIVNDQEEYSLPLDCFAGNKVTQVEYSPTSSDNDYYPLRPASLYNRSKGTKGDPSFYIRKSGKVLLLPVPNSSSGKLKITYVQKMPQLDLRRGTVSNVVLDSTTNTITTLELDVSTDVVDGTTLAKYTRLTIVDEEGNIKMKNVKFTEANAGTGVVTIDPSFTYETGETISVGDYVVAGPISSTHSQLDSMIERYLIAYVSFKIFQRDSNVTDLQVQQSILGTLESEIVESYQEISDDITEIPVINNNDHWGI